jgi:hypothetical protein
MGYVENKVLVQAGLQIMQENGQPLTKVYSKGRAMLYALPNGETVRMRTCNDHVLIIVADRTTLDAKLNVQGTDWLLIVMPEKERSSGKIIAYLVPSKVAVEEAQYTHQEWLALNPNTKGGNRTWNLWFQADAPGKANLHKANNFAEKWKKYRLKSHISSKEIESTNIEAAIVPPPNIKDEVESARARIAKAAGVTIDAVRISIDFVT